MSVDVRRDGRVALITINRPEALNALSSAILEELLAELVAMKRDAEGRRHRAHGRRRQGLHRGRRHPRDVHQDGPGGARVRRAGPGGGPHPGDDAQGHDRGRQRLRAGRRLRAGAGLRHPPGLRPRGLRPARDQPRDHARVGRDAAAGAHHVAGLRQGDDPHRPQRARRRGATSAAWCRPCCRPEELVGKALEMAAADRGQEPRRASPTARTPPTARCTATSAPTWCTRPTSSRSCSRRRTRKEGLGAFTEKRKPQFVGRYVRSLEVGVLVGVRRGAAAQEAQRARAGGADLVPRAGRDGDRVGRARPRPPRRRPPSPRCRPAGSRSPRCHGGSAAPWSLRRAAWPRPGSGSGWAGARRSGARG